MSVQKRILKELKDYNNNPISKLYTLNLFDSYLDNMNIIYEIDVIHNKNKNKIFLFKIKLDYPFKPPLCYKYIYSIVNDTIEYSRWAVQTGSLLNKNINKLNLTEYDILLMWFFIINKNINFLYKKPIFDIKLPQKCLCCTSIICPDLWNPTIKLSDILLEYHLRNEMFNLSSPLSIRYIRSIFNNNKWNLSPDLVEYILNKLF